MLTRRRPAHRCRPTLESLERRDLLTGGVVTALGGAFSATQNIPLLVPARSVGVVQTANGEVALPAALDAEFSGSSLPAGWQVTYWPATTGGTATVGNGVLTVDGARVGTAALFGPGRSLEFTATFSGDAFQHAGFGTDFSAGTPWAAFSTREGGALYARTSSGAASQDTLLGASWLGAAHTFTIDWAAAGVTFSIDGNQVAVQDTTITQPMRPLVGDYTTGGGVITVASMALIPPDYAVDFSNDSLPPDWTTTTGGQVNVSDGRLTVDGAMAAPQLLFGPGRTLEFEATFSGGPFQHIGFGVDLGGNNPATIFSTRGGGPLHAFTTAGGTSQDTALPGDWVGTPHVFLIDWQAGGVTYSIDGQQVAYHATAISTPMRPVVSDFEPGAGDVSASWLRMSPYTSSGTFLSRVFDAGTSVPWGTASWLGVTPANTALTLGVRLGNTPAPDGTWSDWVSLANSGAAIVASSRYLQYRAELTSSDPSATPSLASVTITRANGAVVFTDTTAADFNLGTLGTGLLATARDGNGDPLTAGLVSGPAHGSVSVAADGSFTYTPASGYSGPDSFVYQAQNADGNSASATVTIQVVSQDPAPAATVNTATTLGAPGITYGEHGLVTVTVLASGPTPAGNVFLSVDSGPGVGGTLSGGSCTFDVGALPAGTHTLAVSYAAQGPWVASGGTGTLSVQRASLTVTANNASKVYGSANPAFTAGITGFVNGDSSGAVTGAASLTTAATAASPVGTYAITAGLGTLAAANYHFNFVNGQLVVTPAPMTVSSLLGAGGDRNGTVTLQGTFNEPGTFNTRTVVVAWGAGQGSTTLSLAAGATSFTATKAYVPGTNTVGGVYTITATVTDAQGTSGSGPANVAVGAGNGAYKLQRSSDGLNLQLLRGTTVLVNQAPSTIGLVVVVGADNKSDSLTVNYQYGDPVPAGGVGFAGRDGTLDTLTVSSAAFDLTTYSYANVSDGQVALTQGAVTRAICYTGLESITNAGTTRGAVFNLPGDDNDAVLQRSATSLTLNPADPPYAPVYTFTATKFVNPTESMTVNGGGGSDIVEILGTSSTALPPSAVMNVELTEVSMISSATLTVGTVVAQGNLDIESVGAINGTAIRVYGNVQSEPQAVPGTVMISLVGSGNQTLSGPGQLPNLDVSKSGGTVTVASDICVAGNLTGSGGTFAPSSAYLVLEGWESTVNFAGPVHLYNVEIGKIHTAVVTLLSDLDVLGDLVITSLGVLDLKSRRLTVAGNMSVAAGTTLLFAVDVAHPPTLPRLEVGGTLTLASGSTVRIDTSGSSGPSAGGNRELIRAGHLGSLSGVTLDHEAAIDSVFQSADSLFFHLV